MTSLFAKTLGILAVMCSTTFAQNFASSNVANNAGPSAAAFGTGQSAIAAGYQRPTGIATPIASTITTPGFGGTGSSSDGFSPLSSWVGGGSMYWPGADVGAYLQGLASLQKSAGDYNYKTSAADLYEQEATSRYYDNNLKAAQTFWEKRRLWEENMARLYNRLTTEQLRLIARKEAPARLSSLQFEPVSGAIAWPAVFQTEAFAPWRDLIDRAMRERSGGVGSAQFHHVAHATQTMEEVLRTKLDWLQPAEYMQAKRFLQSLRYEAQLTADLSGALTSR